MSYSWRALTVADTPEWSDLVSAIAAADGTEELYSPEDLAEELEFPSVDRERDTFAVRDDADDALVGFGQLFYRDALVDGEASVGTSGGVHPAHRGHGIGTELMHRLEQRAHVRCAELHPGLPSVLRSDCPLTSSDARELFADCGFTESRFFHEMVHNLDDYDDGGSLSPEIRVYQAATDAAAARDAHTEAFASHWRSAPWSDEEWRSEVTEARPFRPALSYVHPGPDATIDGYVMNFEFVPGELYVALLGVRRAARGRGIGTALLRTSLTVAVANDYEKVALGVDSDNSTGAGRLYETLGFRVTRVSVACLKTLAPHV